MSAREPGWPGARTAPCGVSASGWILLPQELVVQMAEGLLLRHDGDVVEARVGDERGCVRCADAAAGRREQRVRGIGRRVLKVRRVEVDLVGSDGADEFFLEIECGDGTARQVVVEAAIFHRRPVANRCGVQDSVRAGAGDELFHRLQRVEDACVAGRGEGEAFAVGNDCVALGLHLAGHFGWRRAAALRCRAARGRFAVDRLCQRRAVSRDQNVDRGGGVDRDALRGEVRLKVVDGEAVLGCAGGCAVDLVGRQRATGLRRR